MSSRDPLCCNSRIAASLLDALAAVGDVAGHSRVRKVFEDARLNPRAEGTWFPVESLDRAFRVLSRDRNFARRVGAGLVSNQRIGFVLFTEGVATIEKSLRRCDSLFAREAPGGVFQAVEVGQGRARIVYRHAAMPTDDASGDESAEWNESFCGVREGMLEALPMGFGLLPARVRETECVGNGAGHCCYEVEFGVRTFKGLTTGSVLGALLASATLAAVTLELVALPVALVGAALFVAAGGALGYGVDLARQLEVVAGARRGHLALLEQADHALAQKMDELAKINAHEPGGPSANADRLRAILSEREASRDEDEPQDTAVAQPAHPADIDHREIERASEQLYDALGPMQRSLERVHRLLREKREAFDDGGDAVFDALRGVAEESRRIAGVGATLSTSVRSEGEAHEPVDFVAVVSRAVDSVRPLLATEQQIQVDIADAMPMVRCDPFQMEQVAYHLLRNAAEASDRDGEVEVRLEAVPGGVELCVEDHGIGIPEEILDQVFDPFALEGKPAGEHGLGLAICYRIVTEHGGELRVSTDAGEGTRMTVALPCADRVPEEPA